MTLLLGGACDPGGDGGTGTSGDAGSPPHDGGRADSGVTPDGSTPPDGGRPPVVLDNPCGPEVDFCEQGADMGIGGLGYGRGATVVDVDGDGWLDIWRSDSGSPLVGHPIESGLYRNRRDGTFELVELGIAEEHRASVWGGVFGDIDGDGDPDLFLANGGYGGRASAALYRNDLAESGRFVDITEEAGIDSDPYAWWGASFGDYDGDGDLDLIAVARTADSEDVGNNVQLYENQGDGSFVEVSAEVGLPDPPGDMKNPAWIDYDRDGDLDLILGRLYPGPSEDGGAGLFENRGEEGFVQVDPEAFPGEPLATDWEFAFAVAVADFDQDGWPDVYLGRWDEQDYVALNNGDGTFDLAGPEIGLSHDSELNTMGLGVGDFTGNGFPDVFIGPGDPSTAKPPVVYCGEGQPSFHLVPCGADFIDAVEVDRWHGPALGDLDRDFDTDVVWNLGGFSQYDDLEGTDTRGALAVFINHAGPLEPTARVLLESTDSAPTPVGAHLHVRGVRDHFRIVQGAQGFTSQNAEQMLLPLGGLFEAPVDVTWPSGSRETFMLRDRQTHVLVEGEGEPLAPR
ncbi:MAG: FG-GAP repeat domain-containing protein [Myxococcota bacterium]